MKLIIILEEPLGDKKPIATEEETDTESDQGSNSSVNNVPVISGSGGAIQWQLGSPMPDPRARACAVATDPDTIFVLGKGTFINDVTQIWTILTPPVTHLIVILLAQ